ncbi:hypothetical protein D3C73_1087300 [compost metagenome]
MTASITKGEQSVGWARLSGVKPAVRRNAFRSLATPAISVSGKVSNTALLSLRISRVISTRPGTALAALGVIDSRPTVATT